MNPLAPRPAIVRNVGTTQAELIANARVGHAAIARTEKANLERAIEVGGWLVQIKANCNAGEWLPTLKNQVMMDPRTARRWIQIWALPHETLSACTSIAQALSFCKNPEGSEEEIVDREPGEDAENENDLDSGNSTQSSTVTVARPLPDKDGGKPRCERCERLSLNGDDCPQCLRIRKGPAKGGTGEGGGGASKPKPKPSPNGQAVFSLEESKALLHKFIASLDALSRQFGLVRKDGRIKEVPKYLTIREKIEEAEEELKKWREELVKEEERKN